MSRGDPVFRRFWHWLDGIDRRVFGPAPDLAQTIQQHLTEVGSADNLTKAPAIGRYSLADEALFGLLPPCADERGIACTLCRQLDDEEAVGIRPGNIGEWEMMLRA